MSGALSTTISLVSVVGMAACYVGTSPNRTRSDEAGPEAEMQMVRNPNEKPELTGARARLVRHLAEEGRIEDKDVLAAIGKVPRHEFVEPNTSVELAYGDHPLPIGQKQTISQPLVVALMTQALAITGKSLGKLRVLEIGTGSGYQSAVLSLLAKHVHSVEVLPELAHHAQARLVRLGYHNVDVHLFDGYRGWPGGAPYDRILVTAAPPALPTALLEQLAPDGILVAPVGPTLTLGASEQRLMRWQKQGQDLMTEDLGPVRFVPMVPGR